MPMFDAGWSDGHDESKVGIAEVMSLTGTLQLSRSGWGWHNYPTTQTRARAPQTDLGDLRREE